MLVEKHQVEEMREELTGLLTSVRDRRGFVAPRCLALKISRINAYFREHHLSAAVVGVSGGIDSAVALGLLTIASKMVDSPIRRVLAASLPFSVDQGAQNQERASDRGRAVAEFFGAQYVCSDLGSAFDAARARIAPQVGIRGDAWADGQLVAYLRTPALYYMSALLTSSGDPAIVCGTTNRDEGAYLGFFGKASDGMVDLQILSDLHKSEVYALGALLGVPSVVMNAEPTGDVYDGKTHLEMIGATYDFVELYTSLLAYSENERCEALSALSGGARAQYDAWGERIEAMHRYNLHKYASGNPSVHLSILPRAVPGGWREEGNFVPRDGERGLVGEFVCNPLIPLLGFAPIKETPRMLPLPRELGGEGFVLDQLLTDGECRALFDEVRMQRRLPVGTNGILRDYVAEVSAIGSFRATSYSPELAERLWERVRPFLSSEKRCDEFAMTDWCGHERWKPVGINPAFRYIWYETGGELVVHYDAGYDPGDGKRHSLMSLVVYLNDCHPEFGGRTRFIVDPQRVLPYADRNFSDWVREARGEEVLAAVEPRQGRALLFDHRVLHDSEPWRGPSPKVIIRTDVMFERIEEKEGKWDTL